MPRVTYASVKKPTPAIRQTLTWNHLRGAKKQDTVGGKNSVRKLGVIDLCQSSATLLLQNGNAVLATVA